MKPLGYYVLVEIEDVEKVSEGGIVMPKGLTEKEQLIDQIGIVKAIGPTAFIGYPGCDQTERVDNEMGKQWLVDIPPHRCWGIEIGDKVLFEKYAGEYSKDDSFRLIPDSKIIGLIERSES